QSFHRSAFRHADQAQIEDRDRSEEHRHAREVQRFHGGKEPRHLAHRLAEGRGLQRAERRQTFPSTQPFTDCSAAGSFVASVPPACAMSGRPPPLPPTCCATKLTSSPAFTLAVRSSVTPAMSDTLPSFTAPSTIAADLSRPFN